MVALEDRKYTREEYFELSAASDVKLEYHYGHVVAMAGRSPRNSLIASNMRWRMNERLVNADCIVYDSDLAVELENANRYVLSDATVVCGDQIFSDYNPDVLTNPILIVEMLSKSTANYDKSEKFRLYRDIPSLKEYILISFDRPVVESFYREAEGLWRISTASKLENSIHYLYSLDIDIPLSQIYAKVKDLKDPYDGLPILEKPH